MKRGAGQHGFTLLEVLLAVSLSVLLLGAVLVFYRQAVQIRRAAIDEMELVASERLIMDRIANDLRHVINDYWVGLGIYGDQGELNILTTRLPSRAGWIIPETTESAPPPARDVEIVGYRLRHGELGSETKATGLERTSQRLVSASLAEEGEEIAVSLLSPSINYFEAEFWDGFGWREQWVEAGLPAAVRITLGTLREDPAGGGGGESDEPVRVFRRVVHLPTAGLLTSAGLIDISAEEEEAP